MENQYYKVGCCAHAAQSYANNGEAGQYGEVAPLYVRDVLAMACMAGFYDGYRSAPNAASEKSWSMMCAVAT